MSLRGDENFSPYRWDIGLSQQGGRVGGPTEAGKSRPVAANENPPFTAFLACVYICVRSLDKVQTNPFKNLDKAT